MQRPRVCGRFPGAEAGRRAVALGVALGGTACALLFGSGRWTLRDVSDHGPYRAASLEGSERLRFYFPLDGCGAELRPGGSVSYVDSGVFGRVDGQDLRCEAVGVGALASWVRRKGRPVQGNALPRETARFELVHEDESVLLVRGQFPLAPLVFVPGGNDLVAFLPNNAACRSYVGQGAGELQYSRSSAEVLWFGSGEARCPVLGLALPQTR
jgi:hypothetical protein